MEGILSTKGAVSPNWETSPCFDCSNCWCCSNLALYKFYIHSRKDTDFSLNCFSIKDIILGLHDNGLWTVYLNRNCSHLIDRKCSLHDTEDQPWICKRFNPHTCWYKRAFPGTVSPLLLQFNRERFSLMMDLISFKDDGEIESVPSWEKLEQEIKKIPLKSEISRNAPEETPLELPKGPVKTERDLDILKYKLCFPGVEELDRKNLRILP